MTAQRLVATSTSLSLLLKDFFENVEAQNIIDFIKETRFYKQL